MESLSETTWDVLICGTGLPQSLLALALSRSGKDILHVDPNEYYGGPDATLSLQEAEEWAAEYASPNGPGPFSSASIQRPDDATGLSYPRAYSLTLSPQFIHTKSELLAQLVSSRAYRQLEFLAVGSFYIFQPATDSPDRPTPTLACIPSTREDVFSNSAIPARAKRSLMKFLKFVLEYDAEPQTEVWQSRANDMLADFLASEFKLDTQLQSYILTLTLSLDDKISVKDGLEAISRHLTSMGMFGPGFAAVFPKWGGGSEIAQVACRAGAVGGGVYMLGTGIKEVRPGDGGQLEVVLSNDITVKAKKMVQGPRTFSPDHPRISRLVSVVSSPLSPLFEVVVEGAPNPAVAVVAFPAGAISADDNTTTSPVFALIHSGDTGECPSSQCIIYLTTMAAPKSRAVLQSALDLLLQAAADGDNVPKCLYQLSYDQIQTSLDLSVDGNILTVPTQPVGLAFNDASLESVRQTWKHVSSDMDDLEYMKFPERPGADDDDDGYE